MLDSEQLEQEEATFVKPGRGRKHKKVRNLASWHQEFCERLVSVRQVRGLTIAEATRRLAANGHSSINSSKLSKYESGENLPGLGPILKLCQVYDIDPGTLLKGLEL